jgi:hypothetical protein
VTTTHHPHAFARCFVTTTHHPHAFARCFVTTTPGVAACAISGTTFASFLGLNVSSYPSGKAAAERFRYSDLGKRWRSCRTLIIDEISMLNSATFAFAEGFARVIRNSSKPFGGIQVLACGDFFQLPPVARDGAVSFAFEADSWNVVFGPHNTTELKQVQLFCLMKNYLRFYLYLMLACPDVPTRRPSIHRPAQRGKFRASIFPPNSR